MGPKQQAAPDVPVDDLPEDIKSMKSQALMEALRALKQRGVPTKTTGNVPELKQLLHKARQHSAAGRASGDDSNTLVADDQTSASGAIGAGASRNGKVADVMLNLEDVHEITMDCLEKLGEENQNVTAGEEATGNADLTQLLQPAARLVDAIVIAKDDVTERELSSSPTLNLQALAKLVRGTLGRAMHVHPALLPLFRHFEVAVVPLEEGQSQQEPLSQEEQEEQDLAKKRDDGKSALERDVEKRYEQDLVESSQSEPQADWNDASSGFFPSSPPMGDDGEDEGEVKGQSQTIEKLKKEVAILEQTIRFFLIRWMRSFPPPESRTWPKDFDAQERKTVREAVRKEIKKQDIVVNAKTVAKDVEDKIVKVLLEAENFPIPDAKKEQALRLVLRENVREMYNKKVKQDIRAADKAAAGGGDIGEDDDGDTSPEKTPQPPAHAAGKRKAIQRRSVRDEEDDEEDQDDDDATPRPISKSQQGKKRGRDDDANEESGASHAAKRSKPDDAGYCAKGLECMLCFVAGKECGLKQKPRGKCAFCHAIHEHCRILCEHCAELLSTQGRGCGDASIVADDCDNCEMR